MVTSQLDLIMDQVQHLPTGEQLQLIKRVADLLGRANQPQRIESQLAAMPADSATQRGLREHNTNLPEPEKRVDESHFRHLVDQWRRETEHISSLKQACLHPAYQRIIGMGPAVVPYLLRELAQAPDHWFWALNAITEEDPAQSVDSFEAARQAWLAWGKEKGYL